MISEIRQNEFRNQFEDVHVQNIVVYDYIISTSYFVTQHYLVVVDQRIGKIVVQAGAINVGLKFRPMKNLSKLRPIL